MPQIPPGLVITAGGKS